MADDIFWVNASMDADTRARLERMAAQDDRSLSWIVRSLINQEYERRFPAGVSAETLPMQALPAQAVTAGKVGA